MKLTELIKSYQQSTGQKARLIGQVSTTDSGILNMEYYTDSFVEWLIKELQR